MFEEHDRAMTYRGRAEHARLGAEETKSPDLREILLKLALSYDAQADEVERLTQEPVRE